jgi:hypothetical protein
MHLQRIIYVTHVGLPIRPVHWIPPPFGATAHIMPPLYEDFTITLRYTPHSVGLLWTNDQPEAETCTRQHNSHPCLGVIRTRNPSKPATADPRLRPRGYRDRLYIENMFDYLVLRLLTTQSLGSDIGDRDGYSGVCRRVMWYKLADDSEETAASVCSFEESSTSSLSYPELFASSLCITST